MPAIRSHLQAHPPLNRQPEETKLAPSDPELFLKKIHFQLLITLPFEFLTQQLQSTNDLWLLLGLTQRRKFLVDIIPIKIP
jgi:hypothetical protein